MPTKEEEEETPLSAVAKGNKCQAPHILNFDIRWQVVIFRRWLVSL
jgi:hypothetical protein